VKCGQTQQKLGQAKRDLMQATTNNFLLQLKAFLDTDVKSIQVHVLISRCFIMAALCNRAGHYIFALWFLSSFFSLAYSQRCEIGCLPYFHTWCGLSANLECRSDMCCTRLAANTGDKNDTKNRHLCTIAQLGPAMSSQLMHVSTVGKKNLLNSNMSSIFLHSMVNFSPLTTEICSRVWGIPANGFRVLPSLLHFSIEVSQTLHDVWPGHLLSWYIIYTFLGLLPRN